VVTLAILSGASAIAGGRCVVRLFDITGNLAATLTDLSVEQGENILKLNLGDVRGGVYIYEVTINSERLSVGRLIRANKTN